MTAQDLWLSSDSLCSKWGFSDGDEPDWILEWRREAGVDWIAFEWHIVLRQLVREYLLPALAEHHEIEVYDIETSHNPIRAGKIDGREIDDCAGSEVAAAVTPDGVLVPADAVVTALRAVLDTPG